MDNSRRQNAYRYNAALEGADVQTPQEIAAAYAVYHLYVVRVPGGRRAQFQESLKAAGIDTGVHYPIALPYLNAYRHLGHSPSDFPMRSRPRRR